MIRGELPIGIIAVLRYADHNNIENIADSWKMSSDEKKLLVTARDFIKAGVKSYEFILNNIRKWIIIHKLPIEFGYIILSYYDQMGGVMHFHEMYDAIPEKMPFDGNDVMEWGFKGKEVGAILDDVRTYWIDTGFPDREVLFTYFWLIAGERDV